MYNVTKQLNYQLCLLHINTLAVANLYLTVAYHVMLNSVSERSEWIKAAISQLVEVIERYM